MENHLIIGLGGTGGRVLAAFRKLMFEKFNGDVKPNDMWIDYLYMDSSEQDLQMKSNQWNIMGKSVALDANSVIKIPAANLDEYVSRRKEFKYLEPWLGNSDNWRNIINDPKIGEGAAGQKRRLGRLLFANGSPAFNKMVGVKAQKLSYNPEGSKITYHVVAGLASGTGSGCLVDVVAQLRHQFPNYSNNKILLYLLLPEEHPNPKWASTDNYQPNGYVALTELSAMDLGAFKPWNVSEREFDVERLDLQKQCPFYSAYLVTDTNRSNVRFNVGSVIPATIAELIFQKTVGIAVSDLKINKNGNTESAYEFFNNKEKGENPKYKDYDTPHCFKFNGFGIKRLAIPEQEIKEYFGYGFANQAILKLMYNNLSRETGFVDEAPINDDYAFVTKSAQKQKWFITREHLCLSSPILPDHQKEGWKSINDEFGIIDNFRMKALADDHLKHNDKMIAIRNMAKRFYDKDFRPIAEVGQNGVQTFYEKKARFGREAIVNKITEKINADLLHLWTSGEKSLYQLSGIVRTLLDYLEEEKASLVKLGSMADDEIKKRDALMAELDKNWCEMGTFTRGLSNIGLNNSKDDIASKYTAAVKEKYVNMTWKTAYEFARLLIDDLLNTIQVTKGDIDTTLSQFKVAQEDIIKNFNSRCIAESEDEQSLRGVVIKNYDSNKVHIIMSGAIANEKDNKARINLMANALSALLNPEKQNFREVAEKMKAGSLIAKMEDEGQRLANEFFTNEVGKDYIPGYERLIGVNIIQKLEKEFSGNDEGLKAKLQRLVRHAAITNTHRSVEVNQGPRIDSSMFVILPNYDNVIFLDKIEELIKQFTDEGDVTVSRGGNPNEIVVINLETNLTPRYLDVVFKLRNSYERLIKSKQGDVARFETQLEDYKGFIPMNVIECLKRNMLPSLYHATDEEKEELAKTMEAKQNPDCSTGITPPPPPVMSQYMIYDNGQQTGPFTMPQLQQMVMQGKLTKQTYVWKNGMANWELAGSVAELGSLFANNTPPPPPPPMM